MLSKILLVLDHIIKLWWFWGVVAALMFIYHIPCWAVWGYVFVATTTVKLFLKLLESYWH